MFIYIYINTIVMVVVRNNHYHVCQVLIIIISLSTVFNLRESVDNICNSKPLPMLTLLVKGLKTTQANYRHLNRVNEG